MHINEMLNLKKDKLSGSKYIRHRISKLKYCTVKQLFGVLHFAKNNDSETFLHSVPLIRNFKNQLKLPFSLSRTQS